MTETQQMYAFMAEDPDGSEGLMAEFVGGRWIPYVTTSLANVKGMTERVRSLKLARSVRVVVFERSRVLDTITGTGA